MNVVIHNCFYIVSTMKISVMIACFVAIMALAVEVTGRSVRSLDSFEECQADPPTRVDEELLRKFGKGDLPVETPLALHALCMNVKKGIQSITGDINIEGLRAYLKLGDRHPMDLVDRVMDECVSKKGASAQEAAVGLLHCIYNIIPHESGTFGIYSYYQPPQVVASIPHEEELHEAKGSDIQHGTLSVQLHSDDHTLKQPMKIDLFHQFHNDCQADSASRVDAQLFLRILNGEHIEEPTFGLHTLCINAKGGLQSQNGDINQENLRKFLTSSGITDSTVKDDIIKECGHRNGVTASEAAVALLRCLMNQEKRSKHLEENGDQEQHENNELLAHEDHHNQELPHPEQIGKNLDHEQKEAHESHAIIT